VKRRAGHLVLDDLDDDTLEALRTTPSKERMIERKKE
jgi:hypothetical protein